MTEAFTLKDFVKTTLTDITEALIEFDENEENKKRKITPFPQLYGKSENFAALGLATVTLQRTDQNGNSLRSEGGYQITDNHPVMQVEFNVAVTASKDAETSGGVGLRVVEMFKAGVDLRDATSDSSVSRVRFSIPLQLATSNFKN